MTNSYFAPALRRAALLALLLPVGYGALAQSGVTIGATAAPDVSAALDIINSSKGLLMPRVASAAALATPATGLLVFQTGAPAGFYYNAGTPAAPAWQQLTTVAAAAVTASNGLTKTGQNLTLGGSLTAPATILQGGNNLSITGGSVGIGTALPTATLETSGDFRVSNGTVANTLGTPAAADASNTDFPNAGQSFTLPTGGGSITSVRLRSRATYSTTFSIYQGGGNGGTLLYGPAPINFVTDVPSTVALTTPLPLPAGLYTITLTAPQSLRYYSTDVYAGGSFYFGTGAGPGIDMEFAVNYSTGAATSSLYVAPGGNVGIGTSGTSTPGARLDVTGGSIKISTAGQGLTFPDGSTQTTAATAVPTSADYVQNQTAAAQAGGFRLSGSGQVGTSLMVGTALTTGGAATIGGAVTAGGSVQVPATSAHTYSGPKSYSIMYGSTDFQTESYDFNYPKRTYYNVLNDEVTGYNSSTTYLRVPLHLPQGATLVSFTVYYYDDNASNLILGLYSATMSASGGAVRTTLGSFTSSTATGYGSATMPLSSTIDNTTRAYYFRAVLPDYLDQTISGVRVNYTVTQAE